MLREIYDGEGGRGPRLEHSRGIVRTKIQQWF